MEEKQMPEEANEKTELKPKQNKKSILSDILAKRYSNVTAEDEDYIYENVVLERLEDIETMLVYEARPLWEIAQGLGIKYRTLLKMAESESRKELHAVYMREEAKTKRVEDSLYRLSIGFYKIDEEPIKKKVTTEYINKRGQTCKKNEERIEIVQVRHFVPADVNAVKFFLTNRDPKDWKNDIKLAQEDSAQSKPEPIEVVFVDPDSEANKARIAKIQADLDGAKK
jgi:hypothetical protein